MLFQSIIQKRYNRHFMDYLMAKKKQSPHHFHIPVMGTSFTIDTPIRVAQFGISSVISIVDDELCENMRQHYSGLFKYAYEPIEKFSDDYRARRITAYLNLVHDIITQQINTIKSLSFSDLNNDINKYFEMLPEDSESRHLYQTMLSSTSPTEKADLDSKLREHIVAGSIDVNIMTKLDRDNYDKQGQLLPPEFSDALSALRGFANSCLDAGIVLSAGFNRRLYAYLEQFDDFFPNVKGYLKKRIILKVSDFRSSLTQSKFLAKKGLWVSEHRIESGLNCGGHAFATDGVLLGPILDEFKQQKKDLLTSTYVLCNKILTEKKKHTFEQIPNLDITVQGGIGTSNENNFLLQFFNVDGTGWASPFLLVPEATTLDDQTRLLLMKAKRDDFYLSGISPLGVPFNTVRNTQSEAEKLRKFYEGRPGSPCPKGYLISNQEFSKKKVCTASIFYQKRKINELKALNLSEDALKEATLKVINKACLCEDLAASALILNKVENKRPLHPAVCPGPNLSYFSRIATLKEMTAHIYGRLHLLNDTYRPNMFISELQMYIKYFKDEVTSIIAEKLTKKEAYLNRFQENLFSGMRFYHTLIPNLLYESTSYKKNMKDELELLKQDLTTFIKSHSELFPQFSPA